MLKTFRKYHRQIAIMVSLPLILTVITGMGYSIFAEYLGMKEFGHFLLELHSLELLHLEKVFPLLNGLGLIGLLVTGLTMTNLFKKRSNPNNNL
jgi:hypothetical protein